MAEEKSKSEILSILCDVKKLTIQTFTRHAHNYYMYESKIITILIILSRYKKKKNDIHGLKIRSNFFSFH